MSLSEEIGERLVLATHNRGKLAEMTPLLAPLGIRLSSAGELDLPVPEETGTTFEANAALKAEAACRATGLPALADDSGLCVDALDGAPGVYSADWAGPDRDFSHAMARVLEALDGTGATDPAARRASFVSVLALAIPGSATRFVEGRCEGTIAPGPRGTGGFGYDPLFVPEDGDGRTFGEMSADEKEGQRAPLSHRARAIATFMSLL